MNKTIRGRVRDTYGRTYVVIGETENKSVVDCVPDDNPTQTLALSIDQLTWLNPKPDWVSICTLPTRSISR